MPTKREPGALPLFPLHASVIERIFYRRREEDRYFREEGTPAGRRTEPDLGTPLAHLLEFLSPMFRARLALDLGTGLGYSAHVLSRIVGPDGRVLTVERDEELARAARANLKRSGDDRRVAVMVGESHEILRDLTGPYDLIMLDVDKNEYLDLLEPCIARLAPGGHLLADDIGFLGRDFDPGLRPLSLHVARFVQALLRHEAMETIYIPLGDGLVISRKRPGEDGQLSFFAERRREEATAGPAEAPPEPEEGAGEAEATEPMAPEGSGSTKDTARRSPSRPLSDRRRERERLDTIDLRNRILRLADGDWPTDQDKEAP